MLLPLNVLLLARSVEEAAVIVAEPPSVMLVLLMVMLEFWSWLFPIVEEAIICPLVSSAKSLEAVGFNYHAAPVIVSCDVDAN